MKLAIRERVRAVRAFPVFELKPFFDKIQTRVYGIAFF